GRHGRRARARADRPDGGPHRAAPRRGARRGRRPRAGTPRDGPAARRRDDRPDRRRRPRRRGARPHLPPGRRLRDRRGRHGGARVPGRGDHAEGGRGAARRARRAAHRACGDRPSRGPVRGDRPGPAGRHDLALGRLRRREGPPADDAALRQAADPAHGAGERAALDRRPPPPRRRRRRPARRPRPAHAPAPDRVRAGRVPHVPAQGGRLHQGRARPVGLTTVDAVVVGAGPNGIVADAGWDVLVLEAQDTWGGAVRDAEVAAPGFRTDLFSAFYPLAAGSPVIRGLHLEDHGLSWSRAPDVLAHALDDGRAAVLRARPEDTAAGLDEFAAGDGDAWLELVAGWDRVRDALLDALFSPLPAAGPVLRVLRRLGAAGTLDLAR